MYVAEERVVAVPCLSGELFTGSEMATKPLIILYSMMTLASNCLCSSELMPKKGKRKVQGVPQSQTAALPRPQEEEETDKSKQAQTEQTFEKH